jgi:hypothetical protein
MTFDYDSWLDTVRERLETLYQQRAVIDEEIAKLQRGIQGFAPLVGKDVAEPAAGIAESIRSILREEPHRIYSPTAIRDELLTRGVALKQNNPMAAIHQTLARLVAQGSAKVHLSDGKTGYYGTAVEPKPRRRVSANAAHHASQLIRRRKGQQKPPGSTEGEEKK